MTTYLIQPLAEYPTITIPNNYGTVGSPHSWPMPEPLLPMTTHLEMAAVALVLVIIFIYLMRRSKR